MTGKRRGPRDGVLITWVLACGGFVKLTKLKNEILIERSSGPKARVSVDCFVSLLEAVEKPCPMCKEGVLEYLNFDEVAKPTVVCSSCSMEFLVLGNKIFPTYGVPAYKRN